MSTRLHETPPEPKKADRKKQEAGLLETVVCDQVLSALGRPKEPHRIQARCVWGDFYRVNLFVGPDTASFKVAHSFFLHADGDGKILTSSPMVTKHY